MFIAPLASQHLTKTRYVAGLQCPRRLWLLDHEPAPYEEPAPGSPLDIGQEIGRKAHLLFPDGAPTDEEPLAARRLLLLSHSQHPR